MTATHPALLFHFLAGQLVVLLARQRFFKGPRAGLRSLAVIRPGFGFRLGHHQITRRPGRLRLKFLLSFLGRLNGTRGLQRGELLARDILGLGDFNLLAADFGDCGNIALLQEVFASCSYDGYCFSCRLWKEFDD